MGEGSNRRGVRRPGVGLGRVGGFAALALLIVLSAGIAQGRSWGYDLGDELMSPFCPGRTLSSCPSPQAAELVQWIVTQEAAGATKEEVIEILIERFGEEILGAPPAEGITLWAYIFPVAGFALFGAVAFVVLRRIVGGGERGEPVPSPAHAGPTPTPATDLPDDDLARLVDADIASRS